MENDKKKIMFNLYKKPIIFLFSGRANSAIGIEEKKVKTKNQKILDDGCFNTYYNKNFQNSKITKSTNINPSQPFHYDSDHQFNSKLNNPVKNNKNNFCDKEKLYEEYVNLKRSYNNMTKSLNYYKSEVIKKENELMKQNKIIESFFNDSEKHNKKENENNEKNHEVSHLDDSENKYIKNLNSQDINIYYKLHETHLISNMKKQYKEIKTELLQKEMKIEDLKKSARIVNINELKLENETLIEELNKMKILNSKYSEISKNHEALQKEFFILKENFQRQAVLLRQHREENENLKIKISEEKKRVFIKKNKIQKINPTNLEKENGSNFIKKNSLNKEEKYNTNDNFKNNEKLIEELKEKSRKLEELEAELNTLKSQSNKINIPKQDLLEIKTTDDKPSFETNEKWDKNINQLKNISQVHGVSTGPDKSTNLLSKQILNNDNRKFSSNSANTIVFKGLSSSFKFSIKNNTGNMSHHPSISINNTSNKNSLLIFGLSNNKKEEEIPSNNENSSIKKQSTFKISNDFQEEGKPSSQGEEDEVVLTMKEFSLKVDKILSKLAEVLLKCKLTVKSFFEKVITIHKLDDNKIYEAIPLYDIASCFQQFDIEFDTIDIFCLFTKLKYHDDYEMIDVNRLIEEMGNYGIFEREDGVKQRTRTDLLKELEKLDEVSIQGLEMD